jgi:eukaryotic-like serine/threonine-protein kinase
MATDPAGVTPRQWARVEALFTHALDLPTDGRGAFLDRLTQEDPAVLQELRALLDASQRTDRFLEPEGPFDAGIESLRAGTMLGPWRVLHPLGRGGMGEVYAAARADGAFESQAAVKVLKRGLDSDALTRRFLRERRILAQLQHPHIARLLDAGTTADGRPYLVMEQVDGVPITAACRSRSAGRGDPCRKRTASWWCTAT